MRLAHPRQRNVETPADWLDANHAPSLPQTLSAVSDIELGRYDLDTIEPTSESFECWTREASTPENPITFDLVDV